MIVRVNVVLNRTVSLTVTNVSKTCAVVIFRVKVSCITSIDGIKTQNTLSTSNLYWFKLYLHLMQASDTLTFSSLATLCKIMVYGSCV